MLGVNADINEQMVISVPAHDPHELERTVMDLHVAPPHELIHDMVSENTKVLKGLSVMVRDRALPLTYFQHPVAIASSFHALPVVLYLDGVPVNKKESVLAFWMYDQVWHRRNLFCVLRKTRPCRCSCRGWCSLWAVMSWIKWSVMAMAAGCFPDCWLLPRLQARRYALGCRRP